MNKTLALRVLISNFLHWFFKIFCPFLPNPEIINFLSFLIQLLVIMPSVSTWNCNPYIHSPILKNCSLHLALLANNSAWGGSMILSPCQCKTFKGSISLKLFSSFDFLSIDEISDQPNSGLLLLNSSFSFSIFPPVMWAKIWAPRQTPIIGFLYCLLMKSVSSLY